eukprot:SAG11_NODE_1034_length_6091_cov_6.237984_2_plen_65_part_00
MGGHGLPVLVFCRWTELSALVAAVVVGGGVNFVAERSTLGKSAQPFHTMARPKSLVTCVVLGFE